MWTLFRVSGVQERVPRPRLPAGEEYAGRLPLGLGDDDRVQCWSVRERSNLLVVDPAGTGTALIVGGVVLEAVRRRWRVRICDLGGEDLAGFRAWPYVEHAVSSVADVSAVVADTHAEMMERQTLAEHGVPGRDFDPVVIVVDLHGRLEELDPRSSGSRARTTVGPMLAQIRDLADGGAVVNVHVVLAAERALVDPELSDGFEAQVLLGVVARPAASRDVRIDEEVQVLRPFWQPHPSTAPAEAVAEPA